MLRNRDIICISSIDWDFVWQGHQEIMSAFAKNGNRVLYIENTGIRSPRLSDIGRLRHRIMNWRRGLRGIRQESENLFICSPLILPFPYSRIAKVINRFLLLNNIKIWMKAADFKKPIIWTFLPNALSVDIIDNIDTSLVVYYCIAEFAQLADSSRKVNRAEDELLKRCDVVFAQGEKIKKRCERHNANVHIFPFGVKSDIFLKPSGEMKRPGEMVSMKRPILGYVGGIHKHMDLKLLKALAESLPQASIALVGPVQTEEAGMLKGIANVHFLGKKEHGELPAYIDEFDLCLIPYLLTEYTNTVYPTKLNEYLMRGKRVLSTPLPEVKKFVRDFGDVVSISKDERDFVKKAARMLETPPDPEFAKLARSVSGKNSWDERIEKMADIIDKEIVKKEASASGSWKDNFARVIRGAKKRALVAVAFAAIFYLTLFHTPLVWWIAEPLKATSPLEKADVIVAFGGGVGETGRPGQGYEERVKYAVRLYDQGYAGKVIFSSGFVYAFQEVDVMKALAVSLGIPPEDIILEKRSRNTYENVRNSLSIAKDAGFERVIFISSPYHMLRVKLVADKIDGRGSFIYSPIPYSLFYGDEKTVDVRHIRAVFHEYMSIAYYLWKGYA